MLRVFDSMHNLGIKEEDFQNIEAETKDTQKTGIANILIAKKKYLIYIDHDEKHSIYLKEFNNDLEVPSRILFKTLILFDPIPKEIYTLHTIGSYRSRDWAYKHKVKNLEELKTRVIDRFCDDWDKRLDLKLHGKAIYWLFDEPYEDVTNAKSRKQMSTIIKVFSAKNRRLAIIRKHSQWEGGGFMGRCRETKEDTEFLVKAFKPSDQRYNYVSPGREFLDQIWLNDDMIGKLAAKELELIKNRYGERDDDGDNIVLIDKKLYANIQNTLRRQIISAKREQEEEETKGDMESKADKEWGNKGKITRNGILFTKKNISYQDLIIEGPDMERYIDGQNLITAENNDFNSIVAGYIDYILDVNWIQDRHDYNKGRYEYKFKGKAKLKIGKVNIKISADKNIYIWTEERNRIRKDEISKVLMGALSYDDQKEYNKFVEEVSSISLRIKNILDKGLTFQLMASRTDDNDLSKDSCEVQITLNINREKSKNYLMLSDNKRLQINDMNKLFNLQSDTSHANYNKYPGVQRPIKFLFDSVNDITPKDIGDIIKDGKKRFNAKIKKSREFINHAVKITNAEKVMGGYVVKGTSGKEYYIGEDLQVYTWKNGEKDNYLCIVDVDSENDVSGRNDCIAKRLLALSKDKVVAKEIYAMGDGVDLRWKDLYNS